MSLEALFNFMTGDDVEPFVVGAGLLVLSILVATWWSRGLAGGG